MGLSSSMMSLMTPKLSASTQSGCRAEQLKIKESSNGKTWTTPLQQTSTQLLLRGQTGKADLFPQQPTHLVSTWRSGKRRLSTVFGRSPIVTQSQCWGSVNLSEIHS